jgi:2-dehydro-3-deoxygluconokinase
VIVADAEKSILSIGECMLEFSRRADGLFHLGYAGDTFNTAWYLRQLSGEDTAVEYFTRIGRDNYSEQMAAFLEENGIGTRWIARDVMRQPGLYMIETKDGERSFTYWRSQSAARLLADDEALLDEALAAADVVYFSGITLAILSVDRREALLGLVSKHRDGGKLVVFDPNIRPKLWEDHGTMRASLSSAAACSSLCLPSFDDEREWFGDATLEACAQRYLKAGCETVVVKNGGGPVGVATGGSFEILDALEKVVPIDSTGAGDSFNGAYLAAVLAGRSALEAVRFAHGVASEVVRHPGALIPLKNLPRLG